MITVIVPTYNRVDRLRRVLQALAEQTVHRSEFDVVVVSDGSTDGTDEFIRSNAVPLPITAICQTNTGPAAARNAGVQRAKTDLVLFLDDDVVPSPTLVAEHLAAHRGRADTVVIGPMLSPDDHDMSPWVAWEQQMLYKQYDDMDAGVYSATSRQFYTGNASLQREHVLAVGGFDERFRRAEDVELAYRLDDHGLRFHYQSSAAGFHYAERSFDAWCDIASTYGRNDVTFARRDDSGELASFIAWAFRQHHLLLRGVTRASVRITPLGRALDSALRGAILTTVRLTPTTRALRPLLSALYSVLYHRGVAEHVGGPRSFASLMRTGRLAPEGRFEHP